MFDNLQLIFHGIQEFEEKEIVCEIEQIQSLLHHSLPEVT